MAEKVIPYGMTEEEYAQAIVECQEQMASVATYDGLVLERRGIWVWVTGNTRKHHMALKGAGFKYAPKKQAWFWRPEKAKESGKNKPTTLQYIRQNWATDADVYNTEEQLVLD